MASNFTYLRNVFLLAFLILSATVFGQVGWQPLGADDFNQPAVAGANGTAVAVHPVTGEAYMAFSIFSASAGEGFVRKFNAVTGLWEDVGGTFSESSVNTLSLAFDSAGTLYIGYQDDAQNKKATVKKFNAGNSTWETVGAAGFSAGLAHNTCLAIGTDNTLYMSYGDSSLSNKATVKRFDGTNWVTVGTPGFTALGSVYQSLAIAGDNTLYVAFASWYSGQLKASVMTFDGTTWQLVGSAGFSTGGTSYTSMAVHPVTNEPYIAYSDFLNGYKAKVKRFNGTAWEDVGAPGFSEGHADRISFAISSDGTPFVAYHDSVAGGRATVMTYNGTAWEIVGTTGISVGAVYFTDLALSGNTPYMSFSDYPNNNKPTLMKYDGAWVCLGGTMGYSEEATTGSDTSAENTSDLIISADGVPYIGYIESSNGNLLTVKKYNFTASAWETVGSPAFSEANQSSVSMAIHENMPYIAFTQPSFSNKATVMRYNGTVWEPVGVPGFTTGGARQISLAIDASGVPFVIFKDGSNFDRATVMRFNGTNWELVGNAALSVGEVFDPAIMINASGTPYVAFTDVFESTSPGVVMMFDGSDWQTVGGTFNDGQTGYNNLTIGPDGRMYVAFADYGDVGGVVVKRFNAGVWEAIGSGISDGVAYDVTMAIKPDGQLFVSFRDYENEMKATVMRYNGIDWVPVVSPGISAGPANNSEMVVTPDGQYAIIAYSSPCNYARIYDVTCNTSAPVALSQGFCSPATVAELLAEGSNIRWYDSADFGDPLPDDAPLASGVYYVSQMQDDCEGPRTMVDVVVSSTPPPTGLPFQGIMTDDPANATIEDLVVDGTDIKWYDTEGNLLPVGTQLVNGNTYYATQTIDGCESASLAVTVSVMLDARQFSGSGFSYYPNPVKDKLHIIARTNITGVEVYSLYGQKVVSESWNAIEGVLDMAQLSAGIYLVTAQSQDRVINFKIAKTQ